MSEALTPSLEHLGDSQTLPFSRIVPVRVFNNTICLYRFRFQNFVPYIFFPENNSHA